MTVPANCGLWAAVVMALRAAGPDSPPPFSKDLHGVVG
jgi:hypothetical protein